MSDGITAEVHGLKALQKGLEVFKADIQLKALAASLRVSAKPVAKQAESNLQRTSSASSGALAQAIKIRKLSRKRAGGTVTYHVTPNRTDKVAAAQYRDFWGRGGSGIFHAHLVEFGTKRNRARPFLRPAIDSTESQVDNTFRTELKKRVDRAAKKAANFK